MLRNAKVAKERSRLESSLEGGAETTPDSMLYPAAVALSWAATLFPVSGVVKVGTTAAERFTMRLMMWGVR